MIDAVEIDLAHPLTDGDIAVNNLESSSRVSWNRFWRDPLRPGIAESIVEQEHLTAQFAGDLGALDRLEAMVRHLDRVDAESPRTAFIHAQVASMAHRFAEAKVYLDEIGDCGDLSEAANRLSLSADQACGVELDRVLGLRRRMAEKSGRLEDLVPLGALYADLREFDEADRTYRQALTEYQDTSPFAVAWVCFQLGVLWGELVPEAQTARAAFWYRKAVECLPRYVKARVHLAELYLDSGRVDDAQAMLIPVIMSGDPEVSWRLADVMVSAGKVDQAREQLLAAQTGFEALLQKHLLAFADHGAEFYAGSGNDARRAFELANINLLNRPTLVAYEQAYETAAAAGESVRATEILDAAIDRWGTTNAFRFSPLSEYRGHKSNLEGTIS